MLDLPTLEPGLECAYGAIDDAKAEPITGFLHVLPDATLTYHLIPAVIIELSAVVGGDGMHWLVILDGSCMTDSLECTPYLWYRLTLHRCDVGIASSHLDSH